MARTWNIYQFRLGEAWGWREGGNAMIFQLTDEQKSMSAKVQNMGWELVFESDHLVVKFHAESQLTQIWVPEGEP